MEHDDDLDAIRCPDCGGAGETARSETQKNYTMPIMWTEECDTCNGTGWLGPDAEKASQVHAA